MLNTVTSIQHNDSNTHCKPTGCENSETGFFFRWNRKKNEMRDSTVNGVRTGELEKKVRGSFWCFFLSKCVSIFISVSMLLLSFILLRLFYVWLILHSASIFVFQSQSVTVSLVVFLLSASLTISPLHTHTHFLCLCCHFIIVWRTLQRSQT